MKLSNFPKGQAVMLNLFPGEDVDVFYNGDTKTPWPERITNTATVRAVIDRDNPQFPDMVGVLFTDGPLEGKMALLSPQRFAYSAGE